MAEPDSVVNPLSIFFSYSHRDELLRNELEKHLSTLRRGGLIQGWHDRRIGFGAEWKDEINSHLQEADIILLLVSADFIASDYCYDAEMKVALERHAKNEAVVIPVILRPVDFAGTPFAALQALPTDAKPISAWEDRDAGFVNVAQGIRSAVEQINVRRVHELRNTTRLDWLTQSRLLDASIAGEIPTDETREVAVMIRLPLSDGLRLVLEQDAVRGLEQRSYAASAQDVRSTQFTFDFPLSDTVIRPVPVTIRVSSPSFEPPEQTKIVMMPTVRDSQAYAFLVRTSKIGWHSLNIELICDDIAIVGQLLRTRAGQYTPLSGGGLVVAEVPLQVMCVARSASSSA